MQCGLTFHSARGQRPPCCTSHFGVYIGLIILVEGTAGACPQSNTQDGSKPDDGMNVTRRSKQSAKRREYDKRHDPWLC